MESCKRTKFFRPIQLSALMLGLIASMAFTQSIKAAAPELLANSVPKEELRWLSAGEDKFLGLWRTDRSGEPYGAVLILHDEGENPDWPNSVNAMRHNLSNHGWSTFAIAMPAPLTGAKSEEDEVSKREAQCSERIAAAIQYLHEQGQYNIVLVGYGVSAARAAQQIARLDQENGAPKTMPQGTRGGAEQRPIRALVMIAARNQTKDKKNLMNALKSSTMPILDLYFGDHYLDPQEVPARMEGAKRKRLRQFWQVHLQRPLVSDAQYENRVTRRVRGFLYRHARGVAVNRQFSLP